MATTLSDGLDHVHPQMLRVGPDSDRKKLAEAHRTAIGRLVERSFELMGITKQDAAWRMGYRDPSVVSRWCTGIERPLFDKLIALDGFEDAWMVALAERNPRMEVVTQILIRRPA